MMKRVGFAMAAWAGLVAMAVAASETDARASLKPGAPDIKTAGPLAFGPAGVLFVGDPQSVAVFAIDVGEKSSQQPASEVNVEGINEKIAAALGTEAREVLINDLAVSPSGTLYLSVSRGRGPDAQPAILRVDQKGSLSAVSLENVPFAKASLPNAPQDQPGARRNPRRDSITDLAYVDGRLIVAGLSNEEFASKLRAIPFPFSKTDAGTSVEIYHGAHGAFETRSPVRTFVSYEIKGEPHLLAAYTCTPLVKFSVKDLSPGTKIKGTTIAELGNRNSPLDMVVYKQGGKDYILIANTSRGVMKVTTDGISTTDSIEEKINGTAGLKYETISELQGVTQLDRLNDKQAVILVQQSDGGRVDLKTIDLP